MALCFTSPIQHFNCQKKLEFKFNSDNMPIRTVGYVDGFKYQLDSLLESIEDYIIDFADDLKGEYHPENKKRRCIYKFLDYHFQHGRIPVQVYNLMWMNVDVITIETEMDIELRLFKISLSVANEEAYTFLSPLNLIIE